MVRQSKMYSWLASPVWSGEGAFGLHGGRHLEGTQTVHLGAFVNATMLTEAVKTAR